jgi:hypothetical protein
VLGGGAAPSTALNAIITLPNAPESALDDLNVSDGSRSFDAAKQTTYKSPFHRGWSGAVHTDYAYKTAAKNLAEKRIALAGARLAKMLNEELK